MNALMFRIRTGRWPQQDDLSRVNCDLAGQWMHLRCGWCPTHRLPKWECACPVVRSRQMWAQPERKEP